MDLRQAVHVSAANRCCVAHAGLGQPCAIAAAKKLPKKVGGLVVNKCNEAGELHRARWVGLGWQTYYMHVDYNLDTEDPRADRASSKSVVVFRIGM